MAKLLKNISLEERLLPTIKAIVEPITQGQTTPVAFNPTYEQGGQLPKPFEPEIVQGSAVLQNLITPVEQGEGVIKIQPPAKQSVTAQLGIVGNAQEKTTAELKLGLRESLGANTVPQEYKIVNQLSATSRLTSTININFTDQMSLEDRLKQTNLGTTVSLPSFFLSDLYTDFIRIIPFDPVIVQGETTQLPFTFVPIQGGTTILPFVYTPSQGVITANNIQQSIVQIPNFTFQPQLGGTTPLLPIQDVSGLQGIVVQNNTQQSYIQISNFTFQPVQGETTPNTLVITPKKAGLDPVEFNPIINQGGNLPIEFIPQSIANQADSKTLPLVFVGGVPLSITGKTPEILLYEVDRAASRLTPLLKHGGAVLPPVLTEATPGGNIQAYPLGSNGAKLPDQGIGPIVAPQNGGDVAYSKERPSSLGVLRIDRAVAGYKENKDSLEFLPNGIQGFYTEQVITPLKVLATPNIGEAGSAFTYQQVTDFIAERLNRRGSNESIGVDGAGNEYSFAKSGIRQYEEIARVANDPNDFEANPIRRAESEAQQKYQITNQTGDALNRSVGAESDDFVTLKFTSIRDGISLQFRSFLKSFNESFNASYEDVSYIGRPDKLKLYTGNSRGGSLGFMVIAMSEGEMQIMHTKLDRLAQIVYSAKYGSSGLYYEAPFINLTVGDYFKNMPVNISSLKYDMNPTEYSWETNYNGNIFQGPMMFDVALEFNVIGKTIPVYGQRLIDTAQ